MNNTISGDEWLDVIDKEYLSTFIREGGSAVKFAVTGEEQRPSLSNKIKLKCEALNYVVAQLNAVDSRMHMPQDIFFGLASRIDWRLSARRVVLRLLSEAKYRVEGIDPGGADNVIDAVARVNGLESQTVILELRRALERRVLKNPNLAKAFRGAMHHLCLIECDSAAPGQYAGQPLLDWLTGVNLRIGNVRQFGIHTAINRTTARYFVESTFHWVRQAEYSGTVILLDNGRVLLARNPRDGRRYYTRAMTMDHYEMLREFIDDVDRLSGALLIVATGYEFVDDQAARGWNVYDALRTRVMDDVRDRNLVNPVAAVVRLS